MRKLSVLVALAGTLAACDINDVPATRSVPLQHEMQRQAQQNMWMLTYQPRVMSDVERNSVISNSILNPRPQFECRPTSTGRFICN